MCKEGLRTLGVVESAVPDRTAGRADREGAAVVLPSRSVPRFGSFIHYLKKINKKILKQSQNCCVSMVKFVIILLVYVCKYVFFFI